jgi:hypothetical protein
MALPTKRPLIFEDFRDIPVGTVLILHYNAFNRGTFAWLHQGVDEDKRRIIGQIAYSEEKFSSVGNYLYECYGWICSVIGAEPVWTKMPPGEPGDQLDVYGALNPNPLGFPSRRSFDGRY